MFTLHPQLEQDTFFITDLKLCSVLLMNNSLFPWLVLVPCVENIREIIELSDTERHLLMDEITSVSKVMKELFTPHKLNIAALGNQVPQLHVHVIARSTEDAAWPQPVWGKGAKPYEDSQPLIKKLKSAFAR